MAETEVRPVRLCDSCGGVDDHPRHVVWHAPGNGSTSPDILAKAVENAPKESLREIIAQAQDDTVIAKHMDCCKADGCPDGSCDVVTQGAEDLKGLELAEHLVARGPLKPHEVIVRGEVQTVEMPDHYNPEDY